MMVMRVTDRSITVKALLRVCRGDVDAPSFVMNRVTARRVGAVLDTALDKWLVDLCTPVRIKVVRDSHRHETVRFSLDRFEFRIGFGEAPYVVRNVETGVVRFIYTVPDLRYELCTF